MGYFLAVTAFKSSDERFVSDAIVEYCSKHDMKCRILVDAVEPDEKNQGVVFSAINGWSIVLWPSYFNIYDAPLAKALSEKHKMLVSTVSVYDGDYWSHNLFSNGEQLDEYCSIPNYWSESETESINMISKFKGSPEIVAQYFGIEKKSIERYYQHILEDKEYGKAYKDDTSELEDFWVFVDFWQKLGIEYPINFQQFHSVIDFAITPDSKLPTE